MKSILKFVAFICGIGLVSHAAAFTREADPVVVRGREIGHFAGKEISRLALYSVRGNAPVPVPFQVDERNKDGGMSLTGPDGSPLNPDDGKWDENDELVFMSKDLGERASRKAFPSGCREIAEIECIDPMTGDKGYAYLAALDAPVDCAIGRYVSYDLAKDYVNAECYELGYTPGAMKSYFSTLILKDGPMERSPNVLDRFKFRVRITFFFSIIEVSRTEDEMRSVLTGYRDGPIRAIRQCSNSLYIKFGIRSPTSIVDNYYYRDSIEWPTRISLPFNVSTIATEAYLISGCDWNPAASGMNYFNSLNLSPVLVDGIMSEREKNLDKGAYLWSALSGKQGTILSRLWLSDSLVMSKELMYIDDSGVSDPPEDCKGHYGYNGWLFNVTTVPKGDHKFISYFYFPKDYKPGDEKQYLDILDKPLKVKACVR